MVYPRVPIRNGILENSWLYGISLLESQFQSWGLPPYSWSSDHHSLDQRSWDCQINWRTCDIAIEYRKAQNSWFRHAWCDDCVSLEEASQHAIKSPKKSVEEQRAQRYDRFLRARQIACKKLRVFPCNRSLWSSTETLRFVQKTFTEWRRPRFRNQMGSCFIISKRYASRYDPGRIFHVKTGKFCSTSDCDGIVRSRNGANQGAVTSKPLETVARVRDEKGRSSSPASRSKATQTGGEGQKSSQGSGSKQKTLLIRVKFHNDSNSVKIRHVNSGIFPCVWITNPKKRMCTWRHMPFPTCWGTCQAQQEVKERWCERISCVIGGVYTIGLCISRVLSEKNYSTWTRKLGINAHRQILQRHLAPKKNKGNKGSIARNYSKVCASWA